MFIEVPYSKKPTKNMKNFIDIVPFLKKKNPTSNVNSLKDWLKMV